MGFGTLARPKLQALRRATSKRVVREGALLVLNAAVPAIGGVLLLKTIALRYGLEGLGSSSTALSVIAFLSVLGSLGLSTTTIRFLPGLEADETRKFLEGGLTLALVGCSIASAGFLAFEIVSPTYGLGLGGVVDDALFLFAITLTGVGFVIDGALIARGAARRVLARTTIVTLARIAILAWIPAPGATRALLVATVAGAALGLLAAPDWRSGSPERALWPRRARFPQLGGVFVRFGGASYVTAVAAFLTPALANFIALKFAGPTAAAQFAVGMVIFGALVSVPQAVFGAALAELAQSGEAGQPLRRGLVFSAALVVPVILAVLFAGGLLLPLLSPGLSPRGPVAILALSGFPAIPVAAYAAYLRLRHRNREVVLLLVGGALVGPVWLALALAHGESMRDSSLGFLVGQTVAGGLAILALARGPLRSPPR